MFEHLHLVNDLELSETLQNNVTTASGMIIILSLLAYNWEIEHGSKRIMKF